MRNLEYFRIVQLKNFLRFIKCRTWFHQKHNLNLFTLKKTERKHINEWVKRELNLSYHDSCWSFHFLFDGIFSLFYTSKNNSIYVEKVILKYSGIIRNSLEKIKLNNKIILINNWLLLSVPSNKKKRKNGETLNYFYYSFKNS